jgi:hypothetical protein
VFPVWTQIVRQFLFVQVLRPWISSPKHFGIGLDRELLALYRLRFTDTETRQAMHHFVT